MPMRKIIKYLDKPLLFSTILLFIIGLIMVFSASNVTAYMTHAVSPYNYFFKQNGNINKKKFYHSFDIYNKYQFYLI